MGTTILGALFGRKAASVGTASRAGTAMRGAGRAKKEKEDVERAVEDAKALRVQLGELEAQFESDVEALGERLDAERFEIEEAPVRPRKADIAVEPVVLAWAPWILDDAGIATAAFKP